MLFECHSVAAVFSNDIVLLVYVGAGGLLPAEFVGVQFPRSGHHSDTQSSLLYGGGRGALIDINIHPPSSKFPSSEPPPSV